MRGDHDDENESMPDFTHRLTESAAAFQTHRVSLGVFVNGWSLGRIETE